jgi:WD40 repeat protein
MAPRGITADNGVIVISPDGNRLAFATRNDACLWDLKTGKQIKAWKLADGLADAIAFDSKGRLLSCRMETLSGEPQAMWKVSPDKDPRVCRIRDLLAVSAEKPLAEIRDFSRNVLGIAAAPDGSCFVIDGIGGPGGQSRMIKVFDASGRELYEIPNQLVSPFAVLAIDPVGKVMAVFSDEDQHATLWQLASGKPLGKLARLAEALSPEAQYWVRVELMEDGASGLSLFGLKDQEPLLRFEVGNPGTSTQPAFDPTRRLLAWGSENGTVTVYDLSMLWKRMAEIDPDW